MTFKDQLLEGIPNQLPQPKNYDASINHAPKRKDLLSKEEKKLALRNALRYFDASHHSKLLQSYEFQPSTLAEIVGCQTLGKLVVHLRRILILEWHICFHLWLNKM